eukprot:12163403-Alexandrium_andersonii.AAC.1
MSLGRPRHKQRQWSGAQPAPSRRKGRAKGMAWARRGHATAAVTATGDSGAAGGGIAAELLDEEP